MATGFQLRSAWGFQNFKGMFNMPMTVQLRKEVGQPFYNHWMWQNFFWGTDFSGTATNKSLSDTLGGAGGLSADSGITVNDQSSGVTAPFYS